MILYGGGARRENGGGGASSRLDAGGGGGGGGVVLKKGPWTAAEDEILAAYVREHGEGNWNAVQRNTGLARCGKSCRLRWANHLRPNLKKGSFSPEEERLIIQLHAQLGNKWARMAAQLPGRTDNEIKNYWNTRLKRLQRQGLPLYPPDMVPTYQIESQHHYQQQQMYIQLQQQQLPSQPATPCSPFSSNPATQMTSMAAGSSFTFQTTTQLCPHSPTPCPSPTTPQPPSPLSQTPPPPSPPLSSSPHQYPTLPLFAVPRSPTTTTSTPAVTADHGRIVNNSNAFSFPRPPPPLLRQPSFRLKRFQNDHANTCNSDDNTGVTPLNSINTCRTSDGSLMPISPLTNSSYASLLTFPYYSPATPTGAHSYNTDHATLLHCSSNPSVYAPASSPNFLQTFVQSKDSVYSVKPELPSSQNYHQTETGLLSTTYLRNDENQNQTQRNSGVRRSNSGLLEDVLEEAEVLASGREPKRRQVLVQSEESNVLGGFWHWGSSGSISSPSGLKPKEEEPHQINAVQEDFVKLLDVIPSTMYVLDWGSDSGEISNGQSSVVTDDNLMLDVQQLASLLPVDPVTDEYNKNTTPCSWDNLPGIC